MQRKGALPGKIFARCILQRRFAGHFGCMARISCQSQPFFGCMACESCQEGAIFPSEAPFGIHGAKKLPRIAARERTAAKSCHGKTPENASREYIATASQAKSALGRNPATVRRWETHFASILPSSSARERIFATSCQRSGIFVRAGLLPCHSSRTARIRRPLRAGRAVYMRKRRDVLRMETTHCRDGWQPNGR